MGLLSEFGTPRSELAGWQNGSCRGLQILLYRFNSGTGLHKIFRLSSAVEQSAVNRLVVGSNPTVGAKTQKSHPYGWLFCVLNSDTDLNQREVGSVRRIRHTGVYRCRQAYPTKVVRAFMPEGQSD